jgi:hypothetical protein
MEARHPRQEAQAVVGDAHAARVLEPSPPAVDDGTWFADDPLYDDDGSGRPVVVWADWLAAHPDRAGWAAERWLGAHRRLSPPPPGFATTRLALHRLAVYVVSPARRRVNGKIGLRWTRGGFGTPFFGADEQVRVDGPALSLVRQRGDAAEAVSVTTLAEAAAFVLDGPPDLAWAEPFDVPPPGDPGAPLGADPAAAAFLGDWYGFAWSVLEELRAGLPDADRVAARIQLWPEHFDAAFSAGGFTFGASPGDEAIPEPYLYVLPPEDAPDDGRWNAPSFRGALLRLAEFVDAPDQRAAALGFLAAAWGPQQ